MKRHSVIFGLVLLFFSMTVSAEFKLVNPSSLPALVGQCSADGGNPITRQSPTPNSKFVRFKCEMPEEEPESEQKDDWGIIEDTLKCTDCLRWKATGLCGWVSVTGVPPTIQISASLLVEHYLPDFVVAAYSSSKPVFSGISEAFTGKPLAPIENDSELVSDYDTNLDYKNADVFVNPAILVYEGLASAFQFSCKSNEKIPYEPKFLSQADPAWKDPLWEVFHHKALSGFPRMSAAPEYWGPIYPRTGWTSLKFDALSSLVIAQRASEIVTGNGWPHVRVPARTDCPEKCWPPPPVEVGNNDNRFQQIFPDEFVEKDNHHLPRHGSWSRGREDLHQKYAWVLWRKYECCAKNGDKYTGRDKW